MISTAALALRYIYQYHKRKLHGCYTLKKINSSVKSLTNVLLINFKGRIILSINKQKLRKMSRKIYIIFWINSICPPFWIFLGSSPLAKKTTRGHFQNESKALTALSTWDRVAEGPRWNDYNWEMIIISLRNRVITPWPTVAWLFLTVVTGMQNTGNIWLTLNLSRQVDALLNGLLSLNFKTNAADKTIRTF